jgi:outer membrane protein assembly factor BamB
MIRCALLVLALTSTAGAAPWTFKLPYGGAVDEIVGSATEDVLFIATKGDVAAIDATGKERFRWHPDGAGCRHPLGHLAAMPDGGVAVAVFCSGGSQAIVAVLSARGEERWKQRLEAQVITVMGLAALPNAELAVSLRALNRITTKGFPESKGDSRAYLARFDKGGAVAWALVAEIPGAVTTSDGDLVIAGRPEGDLAWVERWSGDGKRRWRHRLSQKTASCAAITAVVVLAQGDIVGAGTAGSQGAVTPCFFRLSPTGELRWLVDSDAATRDVLASAVVLGDALYFTGYERTGSGGNNTDRIRGTIGLDGKSLAIDRLRGKYAAEGIGVAVVKGVVLVADSHDDGQVYLEPLVVKPSPDH